MITIELGRALRRAGLIWQPGEGDRFAVPDTELDDTVFTISALPALVHRLADGPAAAFYGSAEWALDYVMLQEAVWLPHEGQLRDLLAEEVGPDAPLLLERIASGYRCETEIGGGLRGFSAATAEEAYAAALIAALEKA